MFSFNFDGFDFETEYQKLYEISQKYTHTLPNGVFEYNTLLNNIYSEMYPIITNISNYFVYKDTQQDDSTIYREIFDKLFITHNNCLMTCYEALITFIDKIHGKVSLFAKEKNKYEEYKDNIYDLTMNTLTTNANRIIRTLQEDLQKLIIISHILKEKSDKQKFNGYN